MKKHLIRIFRFISKPIHFIFFNAILLLLAVVLNFYFQAFCIPSVWASVALFICFTSTIVFPILKNRRAIIIASFIQGFSIFIFLYIILFLEAMKLYGIYLLIIGLGIIIFVPHFFFIQILYYHVYKPKSIHSRNAFLFGVMMSIVFSGFIIFEFKKGVKAIEIFKSSGYTRLEKNFMTEKILGMHFLYHTKFDFYDGWRPPIHEPALYIGYWFFGRIDPLDVYLEQRIQLYQLNFPNNPVKRSCACGYIESKAYHNDSFWTYFEID